MGGQRRIPTTSSIKYVAAAANLSDGPLSLYTGTFRSLVKSQQLTHNVIKRMQVFPSQRSSANWIVNLLIFLHYLEQGIACPMAHLMQPRRHCSNLYPAFSCGTPFSRATIDFAPKAPIQLPYMNPDSYQPSPTFLPQARSHYCQPPTPGMLYIPFWKLGIGCPPFTTCAWTLTPN